MTRRDLTPHERLLRVLRTPEELLGLTPHQWLQVLGVAEDTRLAGRIASDAEALGLTQPASPPPEQSNRWLQDRLSARLALGRELQRAIRWEVGRVRRALVGLDVPWVLLKGAAYVASDLPIARGRMVSDVDILVPFATLNEVEQRLESAGWAFVEISDYDSRYYREWMHELPPMVHAGRRSVLDVHHAILPRTSRLGADSATLLGRALILPDGTRVLAPADMVLHAAVHLFHDGEVAGGLRDLVDLDGLLRHFGGHAGFWTDLSAEAAAQGLERPLYYALRYTRRLLDTPIADAAIAAVQPAAPPAAVGWLMDGLVERVLGRDVARWSPASYALYVRSHWLKMPPGLLLRHLARKAVTPR